MRRDVIKGIGVWLVANLLILLAAFGAWRQSQRCGWGNIDTACHQADMVALIPLPPILMMPLCILVFIGFNVWAMGVEEDEL